MSEERIEMIKVPDYTSSNLKEYTATQPTTEDKSEGSKQKITDKKRGENMNNPTCKIHEEEMEQIGESERGIPNWICPRGCKLEKGRGQLKMVKPEKGYGFILVEGGEDVFCHVSEMEDSWPPEVGDLLEFKVGLDQVSGKLQAVGIRNLSANGRNRTNG